MARTEPSIEQLLARQESTLERADRTIGKLTARPELTQRQRATLEAAQSKQQVAQQARARLLELTSWHSQKERFGARRWEQRYQRVSEITSMPHNNPFGVSISNEELQNRVVAALSWTPLFRFQRAYCKPNDFITPKFILTPEKKIQFVGLDEKALREHSVAACLVSPDRISNSLVESLRLHKFTEKERKSPMAMLEIKASPKVTDTLKLIFDAGEFIQGSHTRVMVLRNPDQALCKRYPQAAVLSTGLEGSVLYFRHSVGAEVGRSGKRDPGRWRTAPPVFAQHFATVLKAYRRSLHTVGKYATEYEALVGVLHDLSNLKTDVARNWKSKGGESENRALLERVKETVSKDLELLEKVVDPNKKKVREGMREFANLRDSLGRFNPTAKEAQIRAAITQMERRVQSIVPLSGYSEQDRKDLLKVVFDQGQILLDFRTHLESLNEDSLLVEGGDRRRTSGSKGVQDTLSRIVPNRHRLNELHTRPFLTFERALSVGMSDLEKALVIGSARDAKRAIAQMHLICRISALTIGISQLEEKLSDPKTCDGVTVSELAKKSEKRCTEGKFEQHLTDAERKILTDLMQGFRPIAKNLAEKAHLVGEERAALFQEAKESLGKTVPERSVFTWLSRRR